MKKYFGSFDVSKNYGFLLKSIYCLLIFAYISMRILRDGMIISTVGPEGTSIAKVISLILLFGFVFFQKFLLKHFSMNNIIKCFGGMFAFIILLIYFNLIPDNNIKINFLPNIFVKLINHSSVLIFYIMSELFAVFIVTNFWLLCNSLLKNSLTKYIYNQMFTIAQVGVLLASGTCMLFREYSIVFSAISILFVCVLVFVLPDTRTSSIVEKGEIKFKFTKEILLIPCITVLCGVLAGILDPYTKYQIKKISISNSVFINRLSTIWFLQAICSMIFSELFKTKFFFKKFLTPIFLFFMFIILLMVKPFLHQFLYTITCSFAIIFFKTLKYSAHSPEKEDYIRHHKEMHNILLFEGFSGRFGKNIIAIILSLIFSFGLHWSDIEIPSIISCIMFSFIWFILMFNVKN